MAEGRRCNIPEWSVLWRHCANQQLPNMLSQNLGKRKITITVSIYLFILYTHIFFKIEGGKKISFSTRKKILKLADEICSKRTLTCSYNIVCYKLYSRNFTYVMALLFPKCYFFFISKFFMTNHFEGIFTILHAMMQIQSSN